MDSEGLSWVQALCDGSCLVRHILMLVKGLFSHFHVGNASHENSMEYVGIAFETLDRLCIN